MRYVVTLACLAIALTLYAFDLQTGSIVLFFAGLLFEFAFWMRMLGKNAKKIC